jgi:hypothetical protein
MCASLNPQIMDIFHFYIGFRISHPYTGCKIRGKSRKPGVFSFISGTGFTGTWSVDEGLISLSHIVPISVRNYRDFINETPRFLVYGSRSQTFSWLFKMLEADHAQIHEPKNVRPNRTIDLAPVYIPLKTGF